MKKRIYQFIFLSILNTILGNTLVFAQGGGIGGDLNEINLLRRYDRITNFLGSPAGMSEFPDLKQKDFQDLRPSIVLSIVDGILKDDKGQTRSELNFWDTKYLGPTEVNIGSIQFSREDLKSYLGNDAELYVIVFHSALNLLKKEISRDLWTKLIKPSSIYTYSSRIMKYVDVLNADGFLLKEMRIDCTVLYWRNDLRFVRVTFSFDPFYRRMGYRHHEFQYPKGFWQRRHKAANASEEVLSKRIVVIHPFLAQTLSGNLYTVAYADPLHPNWIRQAKILLPLDLTEAQIAFAEISPPLFLESKKPSFEELMIEQQSQSSPGEVSDKSYSCRVKYGSILAKESIE